MFNSIVIRTIIQNSFEVNFQKGKKKKETFPGILHFHLLLSFSLSLSAEKEARVERNGFLTWIFRGRVDDACACAWPAGSGGVESGSAKRVNGRGYVKRGRLNGPRVVRVLRTVAVGHRGTRGASFRSARIIAEWMRELAGIGPRILRNEAVPFLDTGWDRNRRWFGV